MNSETKLTTWTQLVKSIIVVIMIGTIILGAEVYRVTWPSLGIEIIVVMSMAGWAGYRSAKKFRESVIYGARAGAITAFIIEFLYRSYFVIAWFTPSSHIVFDIGNIFVNSFQFAIVGSFLGGLIGWRVELSKNTHVDNTKSIV